jgi:hypothetical protein
MDEEGSYDIRVNCREAAGPFSGEVSYSLLVTVETAEGIADDIYNDIVAAIRARDIVTPRPD